MSSTTPLFLLFLVIRTSNCEFYDSFADNLKGERGEIGPPGLPGPPGLKVRQSRSLQMTDYS